MLVLLWSKLKLSLRGDLNKVLILYTEIREGQENSR